MSLENDEVYDNTQRAKRARMMQDLYVRLERDGFTKISIVSVPEPPASVLDRIREETDPVRLWADDGEGEWLVSGLANMAYYRVTTDLGSFGIVYPFMAIDLDGTGVTPQQLLRAYVETLQPIGNLEHLYYTDYGSSIFRCLRNQMAGRLAMKKIHDDALAAPRAPLTEDQLRLAQRFAAVENGEDK